LEQCNIVGDYYERFPGLQSNAAADVHRLSEIEQEVLAWEQGRLIAHRLGIPADTDFHKVKTECLQTYVNA
jgi:hypothetical protein